MSDSYRINVVRNDRSRTTATDIQVKGAMVISAKKGPEVPVYITRKQESRIIDIFGYPNVDNAQVWEAIEFNKEAPIWLSAPFASNALYGGVIVTKTGSKAFTVGVPDPSAFDLAQVDYREQVGVGDGLVTNFLKTLSLLPYVNQSIDILVNGVSINVTASDVEPEILTTAPDVGDGTLTRATGAFDFTFTVAPAVGDVIEVVYQSDQSANVYFTVFSKSPHIDDQSIKVTYSADTSLFTVVVNQKDNRNRWKEVVNKEVSIEPDTINGFGENVYIEEVFEDDDYIMVIDNSLAYSTFTNDANAVAFACGSRGSAITSVELQAGWDYFKLKNKYPVTIFMDVTSDSSIPAIFDTLRTSYQKYKDYILPLPIGDDWDDAITTKQGFSLNNEGLKIYWNWAKIKNTYFNNKFWTSLIGRVGIKYAQMRDIFNGLAPSWIDENSHGGQLGSGIIEMKYDPDEDMLEELDKAGINPIIFDQSYGVMAVSQKTAQSPLTLSDTSYIGHSRLFDFIISNVINNVFVFQITKLNDTEHQEKARSLTQQILDPILGASLLNEAVAKCDDENNNDIVKAERNFVLDIVVKVTPFSEKLTLRFTNIAQTETVADFI